MNTKQLENMLFYFYNDRAWYKYPEDINKFFEKDSLTKPERQILVQKLVKDGYLTEEDIEHSTLDPRTREVKEKSTIHGWYISFDGIRLIDNLPEKFKGRPYEYLYDLEKKKKKAAAIENFPKRYWYLIAFVSFLIGLIAPAIRENYL